MRYCAECGGETSVDAANCPTCGTALAALPEEFTSGEAADQTAAEQERLREELAAALAPRYERVSLLGRGAMGTVFRAWEPALKREVAVKVVSPERPADADARSRFLREAQASAAISHPNVVQVYSVGETAERGLPYMIMQFVKGTTLNAWAQKRGVVDEREARRILGEVAAGIDAAHGCGLVHRDIKPGNILIEDASGRAFVADFGIAAALASDDREEGEEVQRRGVLVGTPVYMSPEQAGGEPAVPRSDVYSLGVVAYELLTGERPFAAQTALAWATAHLATEPPSVRARRADISPDIARLVDRCLAKQPEERPEAREVAWGMLPTLESEIEWPPPGLSDLHKRGRLLTRVAFAASAAGLLLLLALAAPPRMVRLDGDWWERFESAREVTGSTLGVRTDVPEEEGGPTLALVHIWRGALVVAVAGLAVGLVVLVILLGRVGWRFARSRRLGWKWRTLLNVIADPDGRNGLLVAGVREFAALEEPRRIGILRARRSALGALLAASLWAPTALAAWAVLVVGGLVTLDGAGPVVSRTVLLLALLPPAVFAGVGLYAGHREGRLMAPLVRRRSFVATVASRSAQPSVQDVSAWYASFASGTAAKASAGPWLFLAGSGVWSVGAALSALGLMALTLIVAATLVAAGTVLRWGPGTAELAATIERISAEDPIGRAREVWGPYLPTRQPVDRATSTAWARALMGGGVQDEATPSYPAHVAALLAGELAGFSPNSVAITHTFPPDTSAILEELASHPRTQLLQQLARASEVDLFGAVLEGSPAEYPSLGALPQLAYSRLREAAVANAWAAALAVSRGEMDSAFVRLGENAAFAEHLLFEMPLWFANRFGAHLLRDHALLPLAVLEELRGDADKTQELLAAADDLRDHVESNVWSMRMAGLSANPVEDGFYSRVLTNEFLLPGARVDGFDGGWRGFCANPREILAGLSPLRNALIATAARRMDDVPYAGELAQLTERSWTRTAAFAGRPAPVSRAARRGPFGIVERLRICNAL